MDELTGKDIKVFFIIDISTDILLILFAIIGYDRVIAFLVRLAHEWPFLFLHPFCGAGR